MLPKLGYFLSNIRSKFQGYTTIS